MKDESLSLNTLAKMIDHSLLHPTMTDDDIINGCKLAIKYNVATACIKPYSVGMAKDLLQETGVGICAVIGFPHGNSNTRIKTLEAEDAVRKGAEEIDMVVNVGKVLGENWNYISEEIKTVNNTVTTEGGSLKVIFENDFLEDKHIIRLCEICSEHQVAFVKTSTGFGFVKQSNGMYAYKGAQDHHLKLMRKHTDSTVQIKAAGGVRTLDDLLRVRELGVTRIGATATEKILEEARGRGFE
ncbi:MAG: deoxyribose-phosphate aldolase [Bacteroidales bacterium]|nr:deoxyribose-phosphate aldolase [Bacteroidales bacterium]